MNKKNNTREIKVPVIELYYRTIFTKPAWYWHKKINKHVNQQMKKSISNKKIISYLTKMLKIHTMRKSASLTSVAGKIGRKKILPHVEE